MQTYKFEDFQEEANTVNIEESGPYRIHSRKAVRIKGRAQCAAEEALNNCDEENDDTKPKSLEIKLEYSAPATLQENTASKKKKKKKKSKKDKNKRKGPKEIKKFIDRLDYDDRPINNGNILADIIQYKDYIKVINEDIYLYEPDTGYFRLCQKQDIGTRIVQLLQDKKSFRYKLTTSEVNECHKFLLYQEELQCTSLKEGADRKYILCKNGVLDLETFELKPFSPKYEFTSAVHASFDPDAEGEAFKRFLSFITNEDKEFKWLLQEVTGYIFSYYYNLRYAFMFQGPKATGKSLYLSLIRQIIGPENTSSVNLQELESEYYVSAVLKARVNIAPDIPTEPIRKEISKFKSLTSNLDTLTGRDPYGQTRQRECRTKLVFGSNQNIQLVGISADSVEAFFDRMIFLPFTHRVNDHERDPLLKEKLLKERDYIFLWACKGMHRILENNFTLSYCEAAERMKEAVWANYCPEQVFFKRHIVRTDEDTYCSSKQIVDAFARYCAEREIRSSSKNLRDYLEENLRIPKGKKRVNEKGEVVSNGNPISVYQGITLK